MLLYVLPLVLNEGACAMLCYVNVSFYLSQALNTMQ